MTVLPDVGARLRPRRELVLEEFDDALLIWDGRTSRLHHLDLLAAMVWEELDGQRTLAEIAVELSSHFSANCDQVTADVYALGAKLVGEGLADVVDLMQNSEGGAQDHRLA